MNNKVMLDFMSKTNIKISDDQISYMIDKFRKLSYLEGKLSSENLSISPNIFSFSILEREGVDSSIIEGTQTNHEEMYFDIIGGLNDKYSWEVRNLINLYKSTFRDFKDNTIDYDVDDLKSMHRDLFKREVDGYKQSYDPVQVIKGVKPGKIITDPKKPNWIGSPGAGIENASIILIDPNKKLDYLEDMFKEIRSKKGINSLSILIKFHPIFEAVHPFADGNGRLGRLLLVNLFSYLGFTKYNWIFVSSYWRKNKDTYIKELRKVQTTNNWNDWTYFFVNSIVNSIDESYKKLSSILELYKSLNPNKLSQNEQLVLKHFFKYPILNKKQTVEYLINKHKFSQTSAYRVFDKVAKLINAKKEENYIFQAMLDIVSLSR